MIWTRFFEISVRFSYIVQGDFYECCDLTKKVYLTHTHSIVYARNAIQVGPPPPSAFSEFMFTQ